MASVFLYGSGALPVSLLPSAGLALAPVASGGGAVAALARRLRDLPIPVIGWLVLLYFYAQPSGPSNEFGEAQAAPSMVPATPGQQ